MLRWSGPIRPVAIWLRWLASFGGWLTSAAAGATVLDAHL